MGYLAPDGSIINPSLSTATLLNPLFCEHNGFSHNGLRHKQAAVFCRLKPMVLFALWVIWKSRQVSDPPSKDRFPPFQHQPPSSCCFSMLVTPKNRTRELYPQCSGLWQPCSSETTNLKGSFFHFQPVFLNWAKLDKLQLTGEISDPALAGPTTNDAATDPYTSTSWPSPVNGRSLEFCPKKMIFKTCALKA